VRDKAGMARGKRLGGLCQRLILVLILAVAAGGCGSAVPTNVVMPTPTATHVPQTSATVPDPGLQRELGAGEAVIWYLGHCGYAVRTEGHVLIFDYQERYDGPKPKQRPAQPALDNGFVVPDQIADQRVRVFVTHSHSDHFASLIFGWKNRIPDIEYYFGWQASSDPSYHYLLAPRAKLQSEDLEIHTVNSHHSGVPEVAYLVKVDGLWIYHNGDYQGEFEQDYPFLSELTDHIDLTFATRGYEEGTRYQAQNLDLVQRFEHGAIFPMHDSAEGDQYAEFEKFFLSRLPGLPITVPRHVGERFLFVGGRITRS
jgi:L-ascorbate metabolism protein UlaG (beta-lactamase superfamily)